MNIRDKDFLDINAKLFHNKKNGQISITLPKKQLRKVMGLENSEFLRPVKMPKNIPIRIFKWRSK